MKKIIKRGKHKPFPYFNFFVPVILRKSGIYVIKKCFKFTYSALYSFADEDNHEINKLFGFTSGWHQENSVRFGWRPNEKLNAIQIVGFEYIDEIMMPPFKICDIEIDKWYEFELKFNGALNQIEYRVKNCDFSHEKNHSLSIKTMFTFGYQLFMRFGEAKKAPHDIIIYQNHKMPI